MIDTVAYRPPLFRLPEQGTFQANGPYDPLPCYYKPVIGSIYRARVEQALQLLRPPYESILEVGYGSGILLPSLCALANSVSGIDMYSDPKKVSFCLEEVGVSCSLIQGHAADTHFKKESFDLVVAISTLEHIYNLTPIMGQVHRLLTPYGHFLVGMPRVDHFMSKAFSLIGFDDIDDCHITDYKTCKHAAAAQFEIIATNRIPSMIPERFGLYFNMLFQKKKLSDDKTTQKSR